MANYRLDMDDGLVSEAYGSGQRTLGASIAIWFPVRLARLRVFVDLPSLQS